MKNRLVSLFVLLATACSSNGTTPATADAATDAVTAEDAGDVATSTDVADVATSTDAGITGTYGPNAIKPVMAGFWIGAPGNPAESAGGPFIYLFSGPVTCADLSKGSGWLSTIPAGTQVLEMIVGTTSTATPVPTAAHAAPNVAEVNYATGGSAAESRATSGTVTLTSYTKGVSVDGTIDVTFPSGNAKGSFHAEYCATGNEL